VGKIAYRLLIGAGLLVWTGLLVRSAWVCDDAYITFRVIENWVQGYGLRFNPVERVRLCRLCLLAALAMLVRLDWSGSSRPPVPYGAWAAAPRGPWRARLSQIARKTRVLAAGIVLDLAYLVRVGGDHMTGRMLTAALFCACAVLATLEVRRSSAVVGAIVAIAFGFSWRARFSSFVPPTGLRLVTRAPLFSAQRWLAIVKLNSGGYDRLRDEYVARAPSSD
jgi:hypothetical protein